MSKYNNKQNGFFHPKLILLIGAVVIIGVILIGRFIESQSKIASTNSSEQSASGVDAVPPNSQPVPDGYLIYPTHAMINNTLYSATPDAEKTFRKNIIGVATTEVTSGIAEGKSGKNVAVPNGIAKYRTYVNNSNSALYCPAKTAQDSDRNNDWYPADWRAKFVTWVYHQASGKTNFEGCTSNQLSNYAASKGALKQITATSIPKSGDMVLTDKLHGIAVFRSLYYYQINNSAQKWNVPDKKKMYSVIEANSPKRTIVERLSKNNPTKSDYVAGSVWVETYQDKPNFTTSDAVRIQTHGYDYYKYYIDMSIINNAV